MAEVDDADRDAGQVADSEQHQELPRKQEDQHAEHGCREKHRGPRAAPAAEAEPLAGEGRDGRHHERRDHRGIERDHVERGRSRVRHRDRKQHRKRRAGRRHAGEIRLAPRRMHLVCLDVEAGESHRRGKREGGQRQKGDARHDAAAPEIEQHDRRDAEAEKIGEAVELGAESAGDMEPPGQPAVEAVEDGRRHDGAEREVQMPFDREADRDQAAAQRQRGHSVGERLDRDVGRSALLRRVWATHDRSLPRRFALAIGIPPS